MELAMIKFKAHQDNQGKENYGFSKFDGLWHIQHYPPNFAI
jgi:hypothetical protein